MQPATIGVCALTSGTGQGAIAHGARGLAAMSLRAQAAKVMESRLIGGHYQPGERLSEAATAEELGISRGPIREALQQLGSSGLLRHEVNRGWYVPAFSLDDIRQLYELREALEGMASRLAAQRRTSDDVHLLQQILREAHAEVDLSGGGYPQGARTDLHAAVLAIARNPMLEQRARETQRQLAFARYRSAASADRAAVALVEHEEIIDSIARRKAAAAQRLTMAHIRKSSESALQRMT